MESSNAIPAILAPVALATHTHTHKHVPGLENVLENFGNSQFSPLLPPFSTNVNLCKQHLFKKRCRLHVKCDSARKAPTCAVAGVGALDLGEIVVVIFPAASKYELLTHF